LVEALCHQGHAVRALVHYNSRMRRGWLDDLDRAYQSQVEVVFGDVRDPDQMRAVTSGCQTIFHLAALVGIPYSYVSPRQNVETNAIGTLNILEGARAAAVSRYVHTSTSEVYGSAQYVPIDEDHPLVGQSPYAASKIAGDQLTASYARSFELPAVIVRPFNTFGPRQSRRAVVPTIIAQALWSDRVRLGALDTTRDFTFVCDTVAGFIAAAESGGDTGRVFNLGNGREIAVADLARLIGTLTGRNVPVAQESKRIRPAASEVDRLCSSSARAREDLGWTPSVSLKTGLSLTVDWFRERGPDTTRDEFAV